MASSTRSRRRGNARPTEVNLVSARSAAYSDVAALSRGRSAENYAKIRARRQRSKVITSAISIVLVCALVGVSSALAFYKLVMEPSLDEALARPYDGAETTNFNSQLYEGVFTPPPTPIAPFFILLMGLDNDGDGSLPRSDTLILCYIDPGLQKVAMISIPRDSRVNIPGHGVDKINAAYPYGEMARLNYEAGLSSTENSGPALAVRTVSEFAGVDIAYFAAIDFAGFRNVVDVLGGVFIDVPVAISDRNAGPVDIAPGPQILNGEQALTFVRSRNFPSVDYQRQANQRTFLQALAKQILSANPVIIKNSVESIAQMTYSNMTMSQIIDLALAFEGLEESDIHTYTVPSYPTMIDKISYLIVEEDYWRPMINSIAAGEFPDPADFNLTSDILGTTPDGYNDHTETLSDNGGIFTPEQCASFVVDVRNGWGVKGAATAVSDLLNLAGYQQGEVSNANSFVYHQTLIIYKDEAARPAAEDIFLRLGYGRIISSSGRYNFDGNVLVIVGEDFPHGQ